MSSEIHEHFLYTQNHEWVHLEEGIATIGLTDFAQKHLGLLHAVDLPDEETLTQQNQKLGSVEGTNHNHLFYAPLSGQIIKINTELERTPSDVNYTPYTQGWLITLALNNNQELRTLMDAEDYANYIEGLDI